jgi:DMSO/TMAO reductase YedYZ heme-binding membrane subunit
VNLMPFRRAIGVLCFFFVIAHLLVWAVLDVQTVARVWADIVDRPYVTIGMAAFLLLLPLGLTSNNWSIRKMGAAAWRKVHKLVYPAAVLGALHYVWLAKGFQLEPLLYMAAILGLLALRCARRVARVAPESPEFGPFGPTSGDNLLRTTRAAVSGVVFRVVRKYVGAPELARSARISFAKTLKNNDL